MTAAGTQQIVTALPPVQLFVELTDACNLKCTHCYLRAGEGTRHRLPNLKLHTLLAEFSSLGGQFVSFSGGEPLLYKGWHHAMRYARFLGLETMLLSNGTTLTDRDIEFLREIGSHVAISVDGATPETHDEIRGRDSFARTLSGLRRLVQMEMGDRLTLCFTPSAANFSELPRIVDLAHQLGAATVYVSLLERRGRAQDSIECLALDATQIRNLVLSILLLQGRYPAVSLECLNLKYFTERLRGFPVDADGLDRTLRVTSQGELFLTAYLDDEPFHLGCYDAGALAELWHSEKVRAAFQRADQRPFTVEKCRTCFAWPWCRGGSAAFAWTANGTFDGVDGFCEAKRDLVRELTGVMA